MIAVLPSNHPAENIVTASRLPGPKKANLVWTLDRNGEAFGRFFKELFTRMRCGQSMPMAWVATSPQPSGSMHDDLSQTICHIEAGHVKFTRIK